MAYDARLKAAPPGPLRNKYVHAVHATDDLVISGGFICQAVGAGDIVYRTLHGTEDVTETVAAGAVIGVGSHPVLLRAVRSTAGGTSVSSIVVGTL